MKVMANKEDQIIFKEQKRFEAVVDSLKKRVEAQEGSGLEDGSYDPVYFDYRNGLLRK